VDTEDRYEWSRRTRVTDPSPVGIHSLKDRERESEIRISHQWTQRIGMNGLEEPL